MQGTRSGTLPEPLSVVQLCAPAGVGGLERVVEGLSIGLRGRGHEVALIVVLQERQARPDFLDSVQGSGADVLPITIKGRGYLTEFRRVREVLRARRPDVLHSHGYRSDLLHGGHARRSGAATVSTLHGSSRMGGASHFFEWLQGFSLRRFDAVVAVSPPLAEDLRARGVQSDRIHAVPNAWSPSEPFVEPEEARSRLSFPDLRVPTIGWVGRLIPIKGCDLFLRSLAEVRSRPWTARIIGDGPERDRLESLATELEIQDRVHFMGAIPEAARIMKGFDLFVLSSRSEGTPMVLLEAMAAGRAVVAARVGGVPFIIRDSEEGWLVEPDDVRSLAKGIAEALDDPAGRVQKGRRAEERVSDEYDVGSWIRRHEEVYAAAIRSHRAEG